MAVFLSILAVVGSLGGVVLGRYLATRAQKQQWILDSKKEEYRELLSTLSQCYHVLLDFHTPLVAHGPEEQRAVHAQELKAVTVIQDRLFICDEVERMKIFNRWRAAVLQFEGCPDGLAFTKSIGGILADIIDAAKKIVG
jgi:hypothetical protein